MPWPELHAGTNFNYVWDTNTLAWVKETQPSGGGGAGATIGAAVPATATAIAVKDNSGNLAYPTLDVSGNLLVSVTGAGSGGTSAADGAGYTAGTTAGTAMMGAVDDTGTTAAVEDKLGIARITPQRGLHTNLRTQAGVEAGTSGSPLQVSVANTGANATAIKVDGSAVTQPVKTETQLDYDTGAGVSSLSIHGIALPASGGPVAGGTSTNPIRTDTTGTTTQPISAASLPLPALAATSTKQSDGTQKTQIVDGSGNVIGATVNALDVNIKSAGVTQPVSLAGSGTLTLQASQVSGVANATTTRTTTTGLDVYCDLAILINITAAGAVTGTLQLFLEDSSDGGTTWDDLVSSPTFAFGASLTNYQFVISGRVATSRPQGQAAQQETLAANSARQGVFGDRIRVREKVSGVAGSPTGVTYTITAVAKR